MDKHLTEGTEEVGDRPFSEVSRDRTRGSEHGVEHKKFHLNISRQFLYYAGSWTLAQVEGS